MHDFFEFCNEMLCVADRRGYFTQVNPAWTKTLGWSAEELTSRPFIEFVHPDDVETTLREAQLLHGGTHETVWFENRYRCRDGSYRWLSWQAKLVEAAHELVATARDVTALKQQTEALRDSEERFRLLAMHAPVGIAQSDAEGRTFFVNPKWCEIVGAPPEESMGDGWQRFLHPDDRERLLAAWREDMAAGGTHRATEFRIVRPDGSIRWVSSIASLIRDPAGRPIGQIGATQDITDQRTAERRFQDVYEQSPLGIALLDSRTLRFLQVNPRYQQTMRRTEAEMQQLTVRDITRPGDFADDLKYQDLMLQGKIGRFQMEKQLLRGDGTWMWAQLTIVPLSRPGEPPTMHLAISEDITERKAAQNALRESEERFRAFMDHTPIFAWAKDEQGRFVFVNKATEERFQLPLADWIGKTDFDFYPPHVAEQFSQADRKVLADGQPYTTITQTAADGAPFAYTLSVKFLYRDGHENKYVGGTALDITELKQRERELQQEQELLRNLIEVQEKEKQHLCHEFHDGLIQYAFGSLMMLEAYRNKHPQATETSTLVDTVIGYLRQGVEDGRRVIQGVRPAVLDDLGLEAALQDLVDQFAARGIAVTCDYDPQLGRLAESIETTVYRVVQEALNNVEKHSGADAVRVELRRRDDRLQIEIRDRGRGFDPALVPKKAFGLLGMKERVRLLGGECRIHSELGTGTRITIQLPLPTADGT